MAIRVCICGAWYESKNAGDRAILMAIANLLANRFQDIELTVFSNRPALTEKFMKPLKLENLRIKAISQRYQFRQALQALHRADLFLVGGGTPIYEDRFHLLAFLLLVTVARLSGVHVMTYAISARPIRDPVSRLLCRWILRSIPLITVREASSISIIKELLGDPSRHIELYTDPVVTFRCPKAPLSAMLGEIVQKVSSGTTDLVAICPHVFSATNSYHVHHYEKFPPEAIDNYYTVLAKVCDRMSERARLLFLPMNAEDPDNDIVAIRSIQERMQHGQNSIAVTEEITPDQILTLLRSCRLVVGTRLHSLVFASVTRTPMIAISYGPKVEGFMGTLGLETHTLSFDGLDADALWTAIDRVWNQSDQIRSHLAQRMTELEILAAANADRAVTLVDPLPRRGTLRFQDQG
ncbi:MAG: polysaccharide pyruvyl transferase family protein [Gammaproteobacteria bacterium]